MYYQILIKNNVCNVPTKQTYQLPTQIIELGAIPQQVDITDLLLNFKRKASGVYEVTCPDPEWFGLELVRVMVPNGTGIMEEMEIDRKAEGNNWESFPD